MNKTLLLHFYFINVQFFAINNIFKMCFNYNKSENNLIHKDCTELT